MNDLDMELQTIRQKLQTLKASPPEPVAAPWGQSRLATPAPDLAQVTTAIETLRQRSQQPAAASSATEDNVQQFDAALATVENLAQQQQAAIKKLQTIGNSLSQQIQPGISGEVDDISRFLAAHPTIQVPTVQRDRNGYLDLAYYTADIYQAEHDATSNAETLRMRSSRLFQHPLDPSQHHTSGFEGAPYTSTNKVDSFVGDLSHFFRLVYRSLRNYAGQYLSSAPGPSRSRFTLLDGAIWCIGAAIARIILHQLFQVYPPLWTPVALVVIGGIILNLYRAVLSPRPNPILGYRTLALIIGLLLGGRFL
ncbi:MAG: hypothetical protein ACFB2W_03135 [Leptolyngbyaceae cyanobacterium]